MLEVTMLTKFYNWIDVVVTNFEILAFTLHRYWFHQRTNTFIFLLNL